LHTHLAAPWAKVSLQKETLIVVFYLISDASDLVSTENNQKSQNNHI